MFNWLKNKVEDVAGLSDILLMRQMKKGDRDAFGKLYLRYLDAIYRYIFFRVGQEKAIAEDISETVFFKAWEHIGSFKENQGTFKAWLYMIAKNAITDHFRKNKNKVNLEESVLPTDNNIEEKIEYNDQVSRLMSRINLLTDDQRQVITMKYIEEMPNAEIARILDKNEEAIRALQHRALQKLKKLLT
ncbi:sigma-70 family RNA polymerase sigma factor [Candidatus Roizmanbacteria bacterium]|nr:sigma-70 family RNA polymerase sigma factor [Candidatus Roizmanbacteria bacterium]